MVYVFLCQFCNSFFSKSQTDEIWGRRRGGGGGRGGGGDRETSWRGGEDGLECNAFFGRGWASLFAGCNDNAFSFL